MVSSRCGICMDPSPAAAGRYHGPVLAKSGPAPLVVTQD